MKLHAPTCAAVLVICAFPALTEHAAAAYKMAGRMPDISAIHKFERGVTTVEEVLAALGEPLGHGSSVLPPDYRTRKIYYYEQININDMQAQSGGANSYFYLDMEQKILAVLILDGHFDSYMWFTSDVSGEGVTR